MTVNFVGLIAIIASIAAFIASWNFTKTKSLPSKLALLFLFSLLSIPAFLYSAYYLHILPDQAWFYTLRSWKGSEFISIFLGCAGGCFASLLPRVLMGFPLFGVIAVTTLPYIKPILSPLPDTAITDQWKGDACLQSTMSTCGPASLCTILKFSGTTVSERQVARASFSYTGGTEAWYLARFARNHGYTPTFVFTKRLSDISLPAIAGVKIGGMGHFIAILKIENGSVTFADPLQGIEHISLDKFKNSYSFTGFFLSIQKS
jgi:hypothetical protein